MRVPSSRWPRVLPSKSDPKPECTLPGLARITAPPCWEQGCQKVLQGPYLGEVCAWRAAVPALEPHRLHLPLAVPGCPRGPGRCTLMGRGCDEESEYTHTGTSARGAGLSLWDEVMGGAWRGSTK